MQSTRLRLKSSDPKAQALGISSRRENGRIPSSRSHLLQHPTIVKRQHRCLDVFGGLTNQPELLENLWVMGAAMSGLKKFFDDADFRLLGIEVSAAQLRPIYVYRIPQYLSVISAAKSHRMTFSITFCNGVFFRIRQVHCQGLHSWEIEVCTI